jgi:hypothetical protein
MRALPTRGLDGECVRRVRGEPGNESRAVHTVNQVSSDRKYLDIDTSKVRPGR